MATPQDYLTGTEAALAAEQALIAKLGIPSFLLPSQAQMQQYAAALAKAVIDAVDEARARMS